MGLSFPIPYQIPRRGILALGLAGLTGCVAKPVIIDRTTMAEVRRVAVPTIGFPAYPNVRVLNATTDRLGLVGLVAGGIIRNNRFNAMKAMLAVQRFDPQAYLQAAVAERLTAHGLTVISEPADPARDRFLPTYAAGGGRDAVLDTWVSMYGFVALDDSDASPFRPGVTLNTRLLHTQDKAVMMQDTVAVDGITGPALARDGTPLGASTFRNFAEIEANPDRAVASLRGALVVAADKVVGKLV